MNKTLKIFPLMMALALATASNVGAETSGDALLEKDVTGITKMVYPSVVRVEAGNKMRKVATGVVLDKEGRILTTALISPRDEKITVITAEGKRIEAEFLGFDSETYLALVQAKDKSLPPLAMGDRSALNPGSWICVVSISPEMSPAVTQGIISSIADERMRLNIWVTPGSSGGPVVDENGQMVGLLRGIYTEDRPVIFEFREKEQVGSGYVLSKGEAPSSGMAVAIPVDIVKQVAKEIVEKGRVQRGWLGVSIAQNEQGRIEIIGVDEDSPAELAKLKEGDVILNIEGQEIRSAPMVASAIRNRKPGEDIVLKIERNGNPLEVKVKLGEYSKEEAKRELASRFPRLFPPLMPSPPKLRGNKLPKPPRMKEFSWESRKFIGLYLDELNEELSEFFGIQEGRGLLVAKLVDKGPAEKAGIKVGDIIVRVDDKRVETVNDISEMIQDKKKGDKIKIEMLRDKKSISVDIEVNEEETVGSLKFGIFENPPPSLEELEEAIRPFSEQELREIEQKVLLADPTNSGDFKSIRFNSRRRALSV